MNDPNFPQSSTMSGAPARRSSRTLSGLAVMAVAVVLGLLPWFSGIGWAWSIVMLLGAAIVAGNEFRKADGRQAKLLHPVAPALFAALVAAHAFQLFSLGVTPLLWLLAALMLWSDQSRALADGHGRSLDFAQLRRGYRLYIGLGAAVCLLSLFSIWGRSEGWMSFGWMGGTQLVNRFNPITGSLDLQLEYNPIMYPNNWYWPGFEFSGRSQRAVIWVEMALLGLVMWGALRRDAAARLNWCGPALAALVTLWWLPHCNGETGTRLFFVGLLAVDFAVWKLWRGQESGAFDPADISARFKRLTGGGRTPTA